MSVLVVTARRVQTHVRGLAGALRKERIEVDVFAPVHRPEAADGVVPLGKSVPIPDNGSVCRVAIAPSAAARTARLLGGGRYDVLHLHEPMIPFTSLAALLTARVPLAGTFHMYAANPRWYRVFAPLCRRAVGRLRVRIAVSRAARDCVARICPGEYAIVPNGIDPPPGARAHRGPGDDYPLRRPGGAQEGIADPPRGFHGSPGDGATGRRGRDPT